MAEFGPSIEETVVARSIVSGNVGHSAIAHRIPGGKAILSSPRGLTDTVPSNRRITITVDRCPTDDYSADIEVPADIVE